jgi:hypothetical protein
MRVLQRIFPLVFELDDANRFEVDVLWKRHLVHEGRSDSLEVASPQFVIEDDDAGDDEEHEVIDARSHSSPITNKPTPEPKTPCLAERLLNCLVSFAFLFQHQLQDSIINQVDLLFYCGFTLPPSMGTGTHKIKYVIW